jgi:ferredoxin-NADP reductase
MVTDTRIRSAPSSAARPQRGYTVEVVGRVEAARDAVTLWLATPGTLQAPAAYLPGQFITLALPTSGGRTLSRSYSLCGDGGSDHPWEITVKRQQGGLVSGFIHQAAQPGMRLNVSAPQGVFTLPRRLSPESRLVFVALGSGVTPIYAMLRALARMAPNQRPHVQLHYAYHSPADAIYGRELAALDPQRQWLTQWRYVSTEGGRITVEHVLARSAANVPTADWYICGPAEFKRAMQAGLAERGIAPARVHVEVFASPRALGGYGNGARRARGRDAAGDSRAQRLPPGV